jgi:hypothetical protein
LGLDVDTLLSTGDPVGRLLHGAVAQRIAKRREWERKALATEIANAVWGAVKKGR